MCIALPDGELLDPSVHRIRDVQVTVAVQCQPVWQAKAAGLFSLSPHGTQELPRVRELLDAVVRGADPDLVVPVHTARSAAHARFTVLVERGRTEPAGLGAGAPP
jgi:hypothetical protein